MAVYNESDANATSGGEQERYLQLLNTTEHDLHSVIRYLQNSGEYNGTEVFTDKESPLNHRVAFYCYLDILKINNDSSNGNNSLFYPQGGAVCYVKLKSLICLKQRRKNSIFV